MKFDFKKHLKLSKKPKTSFGFPIREVKNSPKKSENQRGVAIIIALMIITFMVGFIADLVLSSRVANQMSINIEERSKTEYLAGSGVICKIYFAHRLGTGSIHGVKHEASSCRRSW